MKIALILLITITLLSSANAFVKHNPIKAHLMKEAMNISKQIMIVRFNHFSEEDVCMNNLARTCFDRNVNHDDPEDGEYLL